MTIRPKEMTDWLAPLVDSVGSVGLDSVFVGGVRHIAGRKACSAAHAQMDTPLENNI
jgi:hypothetical protein